MRKKITQTEYGKEMDKIFAKNLPVQETLIAMLSEASKYTITETLTETLTETKHEKHTSKI